MLVTRRASGLDGLGWASASGVTTALQAPRLLQDVLMGGGKAEASAPLYRRSYDNASVLICKILDFGNAVASVSGQQQLHWLHILHTSVDDVLRGLSATKVDSSGDTLTFVSGTENEDEKHAASLLGLAQSLLVLCDCLKLPNGDPLCLQLSMHTGKVVSGLVGNLNLKYGVFGETVSTAKYLQRFSGPGLIVASAETVRTLPEADGWQKSGAVKLPNDRMLETFTHGGFSRTLQAPKGICIAPDGHSRGEQQEQAASRAEAPEAGSTPRVGLTHRMRHRDTLVLGMLMLQAMLGALCLALQGRIDGIQSSQQWTASRASGEGGEFRASLVIAAVLMWAGAFSFAYLAPLRSYTTARDYMVVILRCLLLVRMTSAVTLAIPGAMARVASALLEPYRQQGFIPWAALDFLAAPIATSDLQQDLGLPVMMLFLSIVLPVRLKAHIWSGFAVISTILAQVLGGAAPPSADSLAGLLVLGIGLPAVLQAFNASS